MEICLLFAKEPQNYMNQYYFKVSISIKFLEYKCRDSTLPVVGVETGVLRLLSRISFSYSSVGTRIRKHNPPPATDIVAQNAFCLSYPPGRLLKHNSFSPHIHTQNVDEAEK